MSDTVQTEIESFLRRFRGGLASLPAHLRDKYLRELRSHLETQYRQGRSELEALLESGEPPDQEEAAYPTLEDYDADFVAQLKMSWPFTLTGLTSRGGLSNWVFFFLPKEIVMLDVGMAPAMKAGIREGLGSQLWSALLARLGSGKYGPQQAASEGFDDWQARLRSKAKDVQTLRDDGIRRVRLHLRALAHQIIIVGIGGPDRTFQLMDRDEAESLIEPLTRRFGSRFEISSTPVFAFFKRYAPFLME